MKKLSTFKLATLSLTATLLIVAAQSAYSHTRLNVRAQDEGTRIINHIIISHGCNKTSTTIGTSVVFPDGVDSTILVNGEVSETQVLDHMTNYGNNFQLILDRSAFDIMGEKIVGGNVVGFWAGGGEGMINSMNVATAMRAKAASIEPTSCTGKVDVKISIADICEITAPDVFTDDVVRLWTHNDLGTPFDRVSDTDNGPATLTINRDLAANPLPEGCSAEGDTVTIKPSAAQINRDMPIVVDGQQIWPQ